MPLKALNQSRFEGVDAAAYGDLQGWQEGAQITPVSLLSEQGEEIWH
jgi:hypothetical protein